MPNLETLVAELARSSLENSNAVATLAQRYKHDTGAVANIPSHGPTPDGTGFGLFAYPGIGPDVHSTLARPRTLAQFFAQRIQPSYETDSLMATLTGQDDSGNATNPDDNCGTPPTFGLMTACMQKREFGKIFYATNPLNWADLDQVRDRADNPVNLVSYPSEPNPLLPLPPGVAPNGDAINNAWLKNILESYVGIERSMTDVNLDGDPATLPASTRRGFIKEALGVSAQITATPVDVDSNACAPIASEVLTWGADIGATPVAAGDPRDFVRALTDILFSIEQNAISFGVDPDLHIVTNPFLWKAITEYWPCNYTTSRCQSSIPASTDIRINVSPNDTAKLRDEMYAGQYLDANGKRYPVLLTEGMTRTDLTGNVYSADLEIWPARFIKYEFKPMNGPSAMRAAAFRSNVDVLNNGMWAMAISETEFCQHTSFTAYTRIHLETPQLAAKILDIQWQTFLEMREALPASPNYVAGGVTQTA